MTEKDTIKQLEKRVERLEALVYEIGHNAALVDDYAPGHWDMLEEMKSDHNLRREIRAAQAIKGPHAWLIYDPETGAVS